MKLFSPTSVRHRAGSVSTWSPIGGLIRLLRVSLGVRLLVIVLGAAALGMLGHSLVTLALQRAQLSRSAEISAQRMSQVLQTTIEYAMLNDDRRMIDEMLATVVGETGIERVRILDRLGRVHASSLENEAGYTFPLTAAACKPCHAETVVGTPPAPLPSTLMTANSLLNVNTISNAPACYKCHDPQQRILGLLMVETPLRELRAQERASMWGMFLAAGGVLAAVAAGVVPTLRASVFRPVAELTAAAVEIGAGNLDHAAKVDRADELGQLGASFDQMRRQLKDARTAMERDAAELRVLNDVARAASELLDPEQLLSLSINLVAGSPGIAAGGIFLVDPGCGRLSRGAAKAIEEIECRRVACRLRAYRNHGAHPEELRDGVLVMPAGEQPAHHPDAAPPAGASRWIYVPLLAQGREIGCLALATLTDQHPNPQGLAILAAMGKEIGQALANALRYQQAHYRAAIEERDRLAREMHDSLAQALAYLKLKATLSDQLLAKGEVDAAQSELREVRAIAGETYTDVREAIFGLRHQQAPEAEFLVTLEDFLAEYRTYYSVDVQLLLANGDRPSFSPDVSLQVTRIIQEALTNVRKHSGARQAIIRLELSDGTWHISIEDRGRGFEPERVNPDGPQYLGLQIMRERAESIGGALDLTSHPAGGTRVRLSIPSSRNGG